jgi:hypothetical protein
VPSVTATSTVCGSAPKATTERGAGVAAEAEGDGAAAEAEGPPPPGPPAPGGNLNCACDHADEKYLGSNPFCKTERGVHVSTRVRHAPATSDAP